MSTGRRGIRGDSRRARWLRARLRRVAAAILVAAAVLAGWQSLAPPAAATRSVSVAAHDLPAGHRITQDDLATIDWPADATLPGLLGRDQAVGRVLTSDLRRGVPVTTGRVRSARHWPGLSHGRVLVTVPVVSARMAAALRPGDRVDVLARGTGKRLATGLRVARGPAGRSTEAGGVTGASSSAGGSDEANSILVACSTAQAARIARALHTGVTGNGVLLALHPAS